MKLKKLNKQIHKWLSIPLGLIIFIVCLTGAILIFQKEIQELSNPSHYFVDEVKDTPIPLDELIPMVDAQLDNNTVAAVEVTDDPKRTYRMELAEGFRVAAFVNQYTGEVTGKYSFSENNFYVIFAMHRWLLDSTRTWGKQIVGWATLLFIFILITGFIYISKKKSVNYKIPFRKGTYPLIYGLHNSLGVYAFVVLVICSLTGLMWSFEWYRNSVFAIFGAEEVIETPHQQRAEKKDDKPEVNILYWQTALETVMSDNYQYDKVKISDGAISAHPSNTYRTRVQDKLIFDKNSGEIKKIIPFEEQDVRTKVWAWAYSLHVGDYWGIWSKIFSFFFCLVGASLPLTGYYFTYKKWKVKRKKKAIA